MHDNTLTALATAAAPAPDELFRAPHWTDGALCAQVDPELFFPDKGGSSKRAKAVCMACPVRMSCLDGAVERFERFGVWGGLTDRELRAERRRRRAAAGLPPDLEDDLDDELDQLVDDEHDEQMSEVA
jgi:WhiB family transcriptional regulator, redox-sensing transcriptional regulator